MIQQHFANSDLFPFQLSIRFVFDGMLVALQRTPLITTGSNAIQNISPEGSYDAENPLELLLLSGQ